MQDELDARFRYLQVILSSDGGFPDGQDDLHRHAIAPGVAASCWASAADAHHAAALDRRRQRAAAAAARLQATGRRTVIIASGA